MKDKRQMKLKYKYHVVYSVGGFIGSITIDTSGKIDNYDVILAVQDEIAAINKTSKNVVLLNWIELRTTKKASRGGMTGLLYRLWDLII